MMSHPELWAQQAQQAEELQKKWFKLGYDARMRGEERTVPDMVGGHAYSAWLQGYDDATQRMEDQR